MKEKINKNIIFVGIFAIALFAIGVIFAILYKKPNSLMLDEKLKEKNIYDNYGIADEDSLSKKPKIDIPIEILSWYGKDKQTVSSDKSKTINIPKEILDSYGSRQINN